jgi:hypothetical protein
MEIEMATKAGGVMTAENDEPIKVVVHRDKWDEKGVRHRKGSVMELPHDVALAGVENGSLSWHREPADDEKLARTRAADLVEYALEKANRQGAFDRVSDFAEYTRWCAGKGFNSLPLDIAAGRLFLIERAAAGARTPHLEKMAKSLGFIQELCMEAPRGPTGRWLWEGYVRALGFAKHRLGTEGVPLVQRDAMAAEKALAMFPDGNIPSLLSDVA